MFERRRSLILALASIDSACRCFFPLSGSNQNMMSGDCTYIQRLCGTNLLVTRVSSTGRYVLYQILLQDILSYISIDVRIMYTGRLFV